MALMQVVPKFSYVGGAFDAGKVIPRTRPPASAVFRSGGDLKPVCDRLVAERNLCIEAAPGAGKSTVLPLHCARQLGGLVLHVLPYATLARATYEYVSKRAEGFPVAIVTEVSQGYPDEGLVCVSAACLVAKWLSSGRVELPPSIVLHDESHESGFATALMRELCPTASGIRCYARMTATPGPGETRKMETGGSVDAKAYEPSEFADPWSVEQEGAPWSVDSIIGNVLVFEDDKERAASLVHAYNYNGFRAFRLHCGMSDSDFAAVLAALNSPHEVSLCALIADSSFGSGYSFPVTTIVDSGKVKRIVVEGGRAVVRSRNLYKFEVTQRKSRGGRFDGLNTEYWYPRGEYVDKMCDLEQADVEALAYVCRLLGYRPPVYAATAAMASGQVPLDPGAALRGVCPLAALPDVALGPAPVSIASVDDTISSAPTVRGGEGAMYGTVGARPGPEPEPSRVLDDTLAGMLHHGADREVSVEVGQYCYVDGLITQDAECSQLPYGADSVRKVMARDVSRTAHLVWSPYVRSVAARSMASAYNVDLLQWRAWIKTLSDIKGMMSGKSESGMRQWARGCVETVSALGVNLEASLRYLKRLCRDFADLRPCEGLFEEDEARLAGHFLQSFKEVPTAGAGAASEERRLVRQWVDKVTAKHVETPETSAFRGLSQHSFSGGPAASSAQPPKVLKYYSGYSGPGEYAMRRGSVSSSSTVSGRAKWVRKKSTGETHVIGSRGIFG